MKKKQLQLLSLVVFIIGLVATLVFLLGAYKLDSNNYKETYTGFEIGFGKTILEVLGQKAVLKFNFLLVVAMVLPAAAGLINLLMKNQMGSLLSLVLFVGSIILLFVVKETTLDVVTSLGTASSKLTLKPQATVYVSMVLSALGAVISALKVAK